VHTYERFVAWQKCHLLALAVYRVSEAWPSHERYGLVSQARRAAYSAAANIAEGSTKRGKAEFRRYLDISLGSLAELAYCLRLASDLGLDRAHAAELESLRSQAAATTWGLYKSMSAK
jgi:four helix bundle protein